MVLYLAADHAGVELKAYLLKHLKEVYPHFTFQDLGPFNHDSVDYPKYAQNLCEKMLSDSHYPHDLTRGILICGSGIGMSIAANRYKGIRAALVYEDELARLCRAHNDSNVLCLAAKFTSPEKSLQLSKMFLSTEFLRDRHSRRVEQMG